MSRSRTHAPHLLICIVLVLCTGALSGCDLDGPIHIGGPSTLPTEEVEELQLPSTYLGSTQANTFYHSPPIRVQGGQAPYSWDIKSLPEGLEMLAGEGASMIYLRGTPGSEGDKTIHITVTDERGKSVFRQLQLMVTPPPLHVTAPSNISGVVDEMFRVPLTLRGARGTIDWLANDLPPGLELTDEGVLQGIPRAAGFFGFVVAVQETHAGQTRYASTPIQIEIQPGPTFEDPVALESEQGEDLTGYSVSDAGDVNGDGFDDLLVGAPGHPDSESPGQAFLLYGPLFGARKLLHDGSRIVGTQPRGGTGFQVAGLGDIDGDGFDDIAIASPWMSATEHRQGAVHVFLGPVEGNPSLDDADLIFWGEEKHDEAGFAVEAAGDLNGDGLDDLLIGAPGSDRNGHNAGAVYLFHGNVDQRGEVPLHKASTILQGTEVGGRAGHSLATIGDFNGDQKTEIAIGLQARGYGDETSNTAAYLVPGKLEGTHDLDAVSSMTLFRDISSQTEDSGYRVAAARDINGDGFADLLVAGTLTNSGRTIRVACLVLGGPEQPHHLKLNDADAVFFLSDPGEVFSIAGPGDINGDGFDDILIGNPNSSGGTENGGAVYLFHGPAEGFAQLDEADDAIYGNEPQGLMGFSLAGVGDLNTDGSPDFAVGVPLAGEGGVTYVFHGR